MFNETFEGLLSLFIAGIVVRLGWEVGRVIADKLILGYNTLVSKLGLDSLSI